MPTNCAISGFLLEPGLSHSLRISLPSLLVSQTVHGSPAVAFSMLPAPFSGFPCIACSMPRENFDIAELTAVNPRWYPLHPSCAW